MNILIFEYITGGGMVGKTLSASLVKEGEMMLNAVATDFTEIANTQVSVLRDYRLQSVDQSLNEYVVSPKQSYAQAIEKIENNIDALLIIAPETEGVLANLCQRYSQGKFLLLNSSCQSIVLTSDKLASYRFLQSHSIPQISSYELNEYSSIQSDKLIIKPKDGVGCEGVKVLNSKNDLQAIFPRMELDHYLVQPYLIGQSASLSLLCCNGICEVLSVNEQIIIESSQKLELERCKVNAYNREAFIDFSQKLVAALPELMGYIGVDIIITENEILLVEINPRLTTSYVGLKSAIGVNPAQLILHTFVHHELPKINLAEGEKVAVNIGAEYVA